MKSVMSIFLKIYEAYFPWEGKVKGDLAGTKQRTEKELFVLLKDFEICPSLLTKSTCYLLFSQVIDIRIEERPDYEFFQLFPSLGTVLTFPKFCIFMLRVALLCHNQILQNLSEQEAEDVSQVQKFQYLLERMELSTGFQKLQQKVHITNTQNNCSSILRKKITNGGIQAQNQNVSQVSSSSKTSRSRSQLSYQNLEQPQTATQRQSRPSLFE